MDIIKYGDSWKNKVIFFSTDVPFLKNAKQFYQEKFQEIHLAK